MGREIIFFIWVLFIFSVGCRTVMVVIMHFCTTDLEFDIAVLFCDGSDVDRSIAIGFRELYVVFYTSWDDIEFHLDEYGDDIAERFFFEDDFHPHEIMEGFNACAFSLGFLNARDCSFYSFCDLGFYSILSHLCLDNVCQEIDICFALVSFLMEDFEPIALCGGSTGAFECFHFY